MLKELSSIVHKVEARTMLNIPKKVISEVVNIVETAEKLRIKVDWIGKILGEIDQKERHFDLMQQAQAWETLIVRTEEANVSYQIQVTGTPSKHDH